MGHKAERANLIDLEFNAERRFVKKDTDVRASLSAAVMVGNTLFLGCDESIRLESLVRSDDGSYGKHQVHELNELLDLPKKPVSPDDFEEADIEGLAVDNDYLWLVGSHSAKRKQPEDGETIEKNIKRLAKTPKDGNRYLLARIPLVRDGERVTLAKEANGRHAARLRGTDVTDDLIDALKDDEHLKSFLEIPSKDNGFDIEGLAVVGQRLFVGLRGPVLRGWAVILELEVEEAEAQSLSLKRIGPGEKPYRKHFLHLGGLGVRDLLVDGSDLLILAGPTMDLDEPVRIIRWPGGAAPKETTLEKDALEIELDLGSGKGTDHAESMAWIPDGSGGNHILVTHDSPEAWRLAQGTAYRADAFKL